MSMIQPQVGMSRLRRLIGDDAEGTPAERAAFRTYAEARTHLAALVICILVIVADLIAWPLDRFIFPEGALQRQIAPEWRSVVLLCAVTFGLANGRPPRWLRGSNTAIILEAMVISAIPALGLALSGGIEQPAFGSLYFTCFSTIPMLFPFGVRIIANAAVLLATMAAFFASRPEGLHHPLVGTAFGCATSMMVGSVGIGQALYVLSRRSFLQARALEARAAELAELDRAKNDLFANISHELRTPLTLIVASFRRIARESAEPVALAAVEPGLRNAAQLLRLINDLLELARHDAGHADPVRRQVDLAALVRRVVANFSSSTSEGLSITGADQPLLIAVDPRQIRMVLDNLLANAMKFTDPVSRRIEVKLSNEASNVTVQVMDNGVGIEPELLPTIFERFVQGTSGMTRRFAGTGIGLAIVREVVHGHGGTVEVTSKPGQGSTFTVTLPRVAGTFPPAEPESPDEEERIPARPAPAEAAPRVASGARVLVVDDNADLRDYLVSLFEQHYVVATARDGADAMEVARRFAPDLVVTDLMMPNVDGTMLLRQLREQQGRATLPVLFLTARAGSEARTAALELGADDYLTKPFHERELLARVENLLSGSRESRALANKNESLEQAAAERAATIRALSQRLEQAQEAERARIASDLHDELGQLLTTAKIEAELGAKRRDLAAFDRLARRLDEALTATRSVVLSLRPRIIDDLGLTAGLEWLLGRFATRETLDCGWNVEVDDAHVPPAIAAAAFRLVQEALTNIDRHAHAHHAQVEVIESDGQLRILVEDDGTGFDPAQVDDTQHSGLAGMRERVRSHGGTIEVKPRPAGGTRITACFPLKAQEQVA